MFPIITRPGSKLDELIAIMLLIDKLKMHDLNPKEFLVDISNHLYRTQHKHNASA